MTSDLRAMIAWMVNEILYTAQYRGALETLLYQSTFACPSVVDATACLAAVLTCGWLSVNVDAAVSV